MALAAALAQLDAYMAVITPVLTDLDGIAQQLTPLKFDAANAYLDEIAHNAGMQLDQIRYAVCLFAVYPLALIFQMLPSPTLKHLYSLGVGVSLAQFVFGSQWIHSLLMSFLTYLLVWLAPARHAPYIVFLFNMTYMSLAHLYRIYVDYMGWSLDFTGPQMLLVIKLTAFAYNYYDGVVDIKRLEKPTDNKGLARVYSSRKALSVSKLPSLLEFFAYVYCFTTFLAGPAFELREYLDVVNNNKRLGSGRYLAAISKFVVGVTFMGLMVAFGGQYPITMLYSDEVAALPLFERLLQLYICLFFVKAKYYSAWKISEGATVLCGFGFEGFAASGEPKGWNGVSNMDVIGFEFAPSIREGSRAWNKGTQSWLEKYVYSRTGNSLMATYFVSAFWHGFYPGYYIFFMSIPLPTAVNRIAYKRIRPYFLEADGSFGMKKRVYDIVGTICTIFTLHYLVIPFQALSWEHSIVALQHMKFSGHIIMAVLYVVFSLVPMRKIKST
ncbi:lysophospholipid acyltransferase [Thraustotheca clavata]|uniref:Lysophospholipid acyltransferase n=1 Tax=Thraustotheca clavata TaxID=74557 RepID=A0A1V9Z3T1_9STRA|nr:lysophospholipid acyltransferase [Thraustotheca clavata]